MKEEKKVSRIDEIVNEKGNWAECVLFIAKSLNLEYVRHSDDSYPIFVNKETGLEFEFISEQNRDWLEIVN